MAMLLRVEWLQPWATRRAAYFQLSMGKEEARPRFYTFITARGVETDLKWATVECASDELIHVQSSIRHRTL